jgi:N-methylhydantoinase A
MRYVGEGYEVSVTIPAGSADSDSLAAAAAAFHSEHERIYGFSYEGKQDIEIVNLRVQAIGRLHRPELGTVDEAGATAPPSTTRAVYWRDAGWQDCTIYQRSDLGAGRDIAGPCVVEEYGATVVIPANWVASVDSFGNLNMRRRKA